MAEGGRALVRSGRDPLVRLEGRGRGRALVDGRVGHQGFHRFFSVLKKFCGCGRLTHIPNITLVIGVGVRVKLNSPYMPL